nr:basic proline-rich protein-like [Aegilops tauschii subsp. strangulata]
MLHRGASLRPTGSPPYRRWLQLLFERAASSSATCLPCASPPTPPVLVQATTPSSPLPVAPAPVGSDLPPAPAPRSRAALGSYRRPPPGACVLGLARPPRDPAAHPGPPRLSRPLLRPGASLGLCSTRAPRDCSPATGSPAPPPSSRRPLAGSTLTTAASPVCLAPQHQPRADSADRRLRLRRVARAGSVFSNPADLSARRLAAPTSCRLPAPSRCAWFPPRGRLHPRLAAGLLAPPPLASSRSGRLVAHRLPPPLPPASPAHSRRVTGAPAAGFIPLRPARRAPVAASPQPAPPADLPHPGRASAGSPLARAIPLRVPCQLPCCAPGRPGSAPPLPAPGSSTVASCTPRAPVGSRSSRLL